MNKVQFLKEIQKSEFLSQSFDNSKMKFVNSSQKNRNFSDDLRVIIDFYL